MSIPRIPASSAKNTMQKKRKPQGNGNGEEPKKRRKRGILRFVWLVLFIPVVYFGVQVAFLMVPNVNTQLAIMDTMTDSITVDGIAVFSATSIEDPGTASSLYYTAAAGERVAAGAQIATLFATEQAADAQLAHDKISDELALLESTQKALASPVDAEVLLKQRINGLYDMLDVIDSGQYEDLGTSVANVTTAATHLQTAMGETLDFTDKITMLTGIMEGYAAQAVSVGSINAPVTGYFVPSGRYDIIMRSREEMDNANPAQLQQMTEQPDTYYSGNVIGHMVSDYHWSFFTVVSASQAASFSVGQSLQISFPDYSEEMVPIKVAAIQLDEESGQAKIEFSCEYVNSTILSLRTERAQIIFSVQKGIRIDKRALRLVEGEEGVYILKPGNIVAYRRIDILMEDDHYLLVPATQEKDVNEVALYDDIIVDSGGTELNDGKII
ncbi:MAG: HlyD family efflux transporter periplasmic adaptor subunit [Oscillospiraceae bacterium]